MVLREASALMRISSYSNYIQCTVKVRIIAHAQLAKHTPLIFIKHVVYKTKNAFAMEVQKVYNYTVKFKLEVMTYVP